MDTFDDVVIGGGPGGYVCAICLARKGRKVALVERDAVGGLCLNWGCIPSKILLKKAYIYSRVKKMLDREELSGSVLPLYQNWFRHSRERVEGIRNGLEKLITGNGVMIIKGEARFEDPHTLVVKEGGAERRISAEHVVVATGSRPKTLPSLPPDEEVVLTSHGALSLTEIPDSMLVIGGGVIGCEMATLFSALGTAVTIVEYMPQLIPGIDTDVSRALKNAFEDRRIRVMLKAKVTAHAKNTSGITLTTESGDSLEGRMALSAVGITGNIEGFGLDAAGVDTTRGFIPVDPKTYQTNIPHVFAVGDVISLPRLPHPGLAHVASSEGEIAAEYIATGHARWQIDYENIPLTIFTDPEIGACGITKEEADARYPEHKDGIKVQLVPERVMGVAIALEETAGLTKLVVDENQFGKILGAYVVGPAATERIHVWTEARRAEESRRLMAHQVMAHPTFSEVFRETLLAFDGEAVHVPLVKQVGRDKRGK